MAIADVAVTIDMGDFPEIMAVVGAAAELNDWAVENDPLWHHGDRFGGHWGKLGKSLAVLAAKVSKEANDD